MQRLTKIGVIGLLVSCLAGGVLVHAVVGPPGSAGRDQLYLEFLEWEVGVWDATITQVDPNGGPPKVTHAVQTDRLRACGQWLITELMMVGAAPGAPGSFEGFGILGFDPEANKMVGTWVDSLTDFVGVSKGTVSKNGKKLKLRVPTKDTASGATYMSKWVVKKVNTNTRELQIYAPGPDGSNVQIVTIRSVRRPS